MQLLSENAVLYLSTGFEGPFTLQAICVRRHDNDPQLLNLVVTDGQVIIGANYHSSEYFKIQNYSLIRVLARYEDKTRQLNIFDMQVIGTYKKLIGTPSTLTDFLNKQVNQGREDGFITSKKIKFNTINASIRGNQIKQKDLGRSQNDEERKMEKHYGIFQENNLNIQSKREQKNKNNKYFKLKLSENESEEEAEVSNDQKQSNSKQRNQQKQQRIREELEKPFEQQQDDYISHIISSNSKAKILQKSRTLKKQEIKYEGNMKNIKQINQLSMIKEQPQNTLKIAIPKIQARNIAKENQQKHSNNKDTLQLQNCRPSTSNKIQMIRQLQEKQSNWTLLCRVNHSSVVQCSTKKYANNFIVIDQQGSEIKCVYFSDAVQEATQLIRVGQYYLFSGGELKINKQLDLQIIFDKFSDIFPQTYETFQKNRSNICQTIQNNTNSTHFKSNNASHSSNSSNSKVLRIDSIELLQHGKEVSVIGLVNNIKLKQQVKSKIKFLATLSDPIRLIAIDFMLFISNIEAEIEVGMVITLHNYQVYKQGPIYRLNSTYKSYSFKENYHTNSLVTQFYKSLLNSGKNSFKSSDMCEKIVSSDRTSEKGYDKSSETASEHKTVYDKTLTTYDKTLIVNALSMMTNCRNLSSFPFTFRNIKQLQNICTCTEDDKIYSSIDCWILEFDKKKFYLACKLCKKTSPDQKSNLFFCPSCKIEVQAIQTCTLSLLVADCTGSFHLDVIGEHAETILEIKSIGFVGFIEKSRTQQDLHYQRLKYKNYQIKLKTDIKTSGEKRVCHGVWAIIDRPSCISTIKEIKNKLRLLSYKMEESEQW